MLKIIFKFFVDYFCPPRNRIEYNEIYFKHLLTKSNDEFINSLSIKNE